MQQRLLETFTAFTWTARMARGGVQVWCVLQLIWVLTALSQHCVEEECEDGANTKPVILRSDPGLRVVITSKGLDYVRELVLPLLQDELTKLEIPEISGKSDVKVANIKYKFKDIHLTEANIGKSSLESDSDTGLTLTVSSVLLRVEGKWSYKSWAASDDGSVRIKADGVSLRVSVLIGADSIGQPFLKSHSCDFRAGHISVKFKGGASWLYNLFDSVVEGKIKDALNSKVCNLISDNVKNSAREALASFSTTVSLDREASLSYALMDAPTYTPSAIVTDHKGEFYVEGESRITFPFSPSSLPPLPTSGDSTKMISLWLTDYVANTAAVVYSRLGYLQYSITPEDVGDSDSFFKLDTSTFSFMIPKLNEKYPNRPLTLGIRCTENPPTVKITPHGAQLVFPAAIDFRVVEGGPEDTVLLFTLGVVVSLDLQAWIELSRDDQLLLKANASYVNADSSILDSAIGEIDDKTVKSVWNAVSILCQIFLMPQINRLTNEGFPIPMVEGVSFVNPSLTLGEGYILIDTDIIYRE